MRISDWSSDVCSSDLAAPVDLDAVPDGNSDGKLRRIRGTVTKVLRAAGSDNWGIVKVALSDKSVVTLRGTFLGEVQHSVGERSEEHTSELQSLMRSSYAVFCLKKKHNTHRTLHHNN